MKKAPDQYCDWSEAEMYSAEPGRSHEGLR